MATTASTTVSTIVLTPPQIPLDIAPVVGADVGLRIVNYYKDPLGLMVVFGPWQNQDRLETVHLHLNGNPKPVSSEIVQSTNAAVILRLSMGLLVDGVNVLHCVVERPSGNTEKSLDLTMLYHINAPGGDDPIPGGGHSKLLTNISHNIIDAAQAALGVLLTIDYPHKQLYDVITINCGGVIITVRLDPTPSNPNPDLSKPIVVTLTTQHFANDRNNPLFEIKYNVISQLANFSGTTRLGNFDAQDHWSKTLVVDVRLDQVLLDPAILREILSDNNDKPEEVDLDKMKGGPLWALVYLSSLVWKTGDKIHLIFEARLNDATVGNYQVTLPIDTVPRQMAIDIPNVEVVADSQLKVTYKQLRGGKVIAVSEVAEAHVVGKRPPDGEVVDDQPFFDSLGGWTINPFNRGIFEVQGGSKCLRLAGAHGHTALYKDFILKPGQYQLSFDARNLGYHPSEVLAGLSGKLIKQPCVDEWARYSVEFQASGNNRVFFSWEPWARELGAAIRNLLLVRLADTL